MVDCKAKRIEKQNNTVRWSVKQQQVKVLNITLEILVTVLQIVPFS